VCEVTLDTTGYIVGHNQVDIVCNNSGTNITATADITVLDATTKVITALVEGELQLGNTSKTVQITVTGFNIADFATKLSASYQSLNFTD
jgi:hypothetical protein